jgi:hypothetical protein
LRRGDGLGRSQKGTPPTKIPTNWRDLMQSISDLFLIVALASVVVLALRFLGV